MANLEKANCGTTFSALNRSRALQQPQSQDCNVTSGPATMVTTDTLTGGVQNSAQRLTMRLQELSDRLAGRSSGLNSECPPAGSSINERLAATGRWFEESHELLTQIASSLGYEV